LSAFGPILTSGGPDVDALVAERDSVLDAATDIVVGAAADGKLEAGANVVL